MITAISRWLTPPVFHDADKARRAAVLNVALLTALLLIGLVMVGNLLGGRTPTGVMVLDGTIVGVCLLFRWWMRRGHLTSAAVGFMVFSVVITAAVSAALGSLRTPTTAAFMLVVVMGGLLFDVTGLVATTIACSASVFGLMVAEQNGWLPPADSQVTITQWFTYTTFFAWVGSLVAVAVRLTRQALYRAEQESGERQRVSEIERAQRTLSEALQAATTTMTSTLDFELVLDRILVEVSRVVACDTAAVYQVEGATARAIRWHTVTNRPEPELSQRQFDVTTTRNFAELLETRQRWLSQIPERGRAGSWPPRKPGSNRMWGCSFSHMAGSSACWKWTRLCPTSTTRQRLRHSGSLPLRRRLRWRTHASMLKLNGITKNWSSAFLSGRAS